MCSYGNVPMEMSLVDWHTFPEALLSLSQVIDVQTERTIVQPVVRLILVSRSPLSQKQYFHLLFETIILNFIQTAAYIRNVHS